MKIGVFSDSHDHLDNIRKVIHEFVTNKVDKIIHCGDMISPFIKRAMNELDAHVNIERIAVYGNNDGERAGLKTMLKGILEIKGDFHDFECDGLLIAVIHGTDNRLLDALIASKKYHLILCGHTHLLRNDLIDGVLVVNPGETCGYLTGKATYAIINLEKRPLTQENVQILTM